ncbi:hypothetical protein KJ708_05950 [bacterium]|nr:hypothetical protein [bacterium]MBU1918251.1 hypothetical protein [bacterium]
MPDYSEPGWYRICFDYDKITIDFGNFIMMITFEELFNDIEQIRNYIDTYQFVINEDPDADDDILELDSIQDIHAIDFHNAAQVIVFDGRIVGFQQ